MVNKCVFLYNPLILYFFREYLLISHLNKWCHYFIFFSCSLFLFLSPLFSLQIIFFSSMFFFVLLSMSVLDVMHLFLKNYSPSVLLHSNQWPEMLTYITWAVSRVSVTFWLPCGSVNGNPHWVTLCHIMGFLGGTG